MINLVRFRSVVVNRLVFLLMLIIIIPALKSYAAMTETQINVAIESQTSGRMPGAKISSVACDPLANPTLDTEKTEVVDNYYPTRSCSGQNISRDDFAVQITFDPNYGGNEQVEIDVPGELQLPDNITTIYGESGELICDNSSAEKCEEGDFTHTGSGEDVLYNGYPIYSSKITLKYPTTGYIYDYVYNSSTNQYDSNIQTYTASCTDTTPGYIDGGHREGENIEYEGNGTTVYDKDCQIEKDACDNDVVSGSDMYVLSGETCIQQTTLGSKITSVRGEGTTETRASSLFLTRFASDFFSDISKAAIMDLDPSEVKVWIKEGEIVYPHEIALTSFWVEFEGSNACVYSSSKTAGVTWRVQKSYPTSIEDVLDLYKLQLENSVAYAPLATYTMEHCVPLPDSELASREILNFGGLISDVCTDYNTSSSMWVKPFTGIVVECIEETLMNIFIPTTITVDGVEVTSNDSFFIKMQYNLKSIIKALLALYIIFFGYRLLVATKVPNQSEWMWLGIKAAIIIHFSIGTGMIDLFPKLTAASKYLSLIVMEAGLGEYDENREPLAIEVFNARTAYTSTTNIDQINADIVAKEKELADVEQELIDKQSEYDEALISQNELCTEVDELEAYKNEKNAELEQIQNEVNDLEQQYKDAINAITEVLTNSAEAMDELGSYYEEYYKNRYDASIALVNVLAVQAAEASMNDAKAALDLANNPIVLSADSFDAGSVDTPTGVFKNFYITLPLDTTKSYTISYTIDSVIDCCNTPDYLVGVTINGRRGVLLSQYNFEEGTITVKEESFTFTPTTATNVMNFVAGSESQAKITDIVITPINESDSEEQVAYDAAVKAYNDAVAAYDLLNYTEDVVSLDELQSEYNSFIESNPDGNFVTDVTELQYTQAKDISNAANQFTTSIFGTMTYLDASSWLNGIAESDVDQDDINSLESVTKTIVGYIKEDFIDLQKAINDSGISDTNLQSLVDTTDEILDEAVGEIELAKSTVESTSSLLCIKGGTCYLGYSYVDASGNTVTIEENGVYPFSSLSTLTEEYTQAYNAWIVAQDACALATDIIYKEDSDSQTISGIKKDIEDLTAEKDILNDELTDLRTDADNSELSIDAAQTRLDAAYADLDIYDTTQAESESYSGYNYCDFRYVYDYPEGKEYMKLWDTIDCKVSKYLGIGDNKYSETTPQVLWVGLISLISTDENKGGTPLGIPIFLLTIIVTMVILIVVFRIVHIYIMAFMSLVMLVYISPIIIPAALFKYTNDMFENWFKQILANLLQPVLLFAFVSFMFAVMDISYFGKNHRFVISDYSDVAFDEDGNAYGGIPYQIARESDTSEDDVTVTETADTDSTVSELSQAVLPEQCAEAKVLGCMYQTADIYTEPLHLIDTEYDPDIEIVLIKKGTTITDILEEETLSDAAEASSEEEEAVTYRVNLSDDKDMDLLVGILKMLLICFIISSLLKTIEDLTAKLVRASSLTSGAAQGAMFSDKDGNVSGVGSITSMISQKSMAATNGFFSSVINSGIFKSAKDDIKSKRDGIKNTAKEGGANKMQHPGSGDKRIKKSSGKAVAEGQIEGE